MASEHAHAGDERLSFDARLRNALREQRADDSFDIHGALRDMLADLGTTPEESGGTINFRGLDPIVPSVVRLGAAAALGLVQQSVIAAALHRDRGGIGQDIEVHLAQAIRRLAPGFERKWELLNGLPPSFEDTSFGALLGFYRTADGHEVMAANFYPALKARMLAELDCADSAVAMAQAISLRTADELEQTFERAGIVMCKVRTLDEFMAEPVYAYLAAQPLISIKRIADSPIEPLPPAGDRPLTNIRALGMGHVIAGSGMGRSLASLGADVLNLWRPGEFESHALYISANVGVRSAWLDPRFNAGRARLLDLMAGTDIFFANRRPGLLASLGLDATDAAAIRPGIIHVTMSTYGENGPWANRPGFDQIAGAVTGMLSFEGSPGKAALPPTIIVNDYLVSWLAATGAMVALRRRAKEGGSWKVHVSLTRVALWILSLGIFNKDYARRTAGQVGNHALIDPQTFQAETPLGLYQGVTENVQMSATPRRFDTVLVARGSSRPEWLTRDLA